ALQWDTPFGRAANDVDIYLVDDDMVIWAESISDNIAGGDPVEVLHFTNNLGGIFGSKTTQFHLIIAHFAGPEAGLMKYVLFKSSGVTVQEYHTASATLYGHANAVGAEAVGAAFYLQTPAYGQSPPLLEYFSSAGGTPILFDAAGGATYDLRQKPEIVGPDGVNTTFFYADTNRDPDAWPNFFGTSAAAPHAAAVAALLRSYNPALLPTEIYAALETSAIDMNAPGFDHDSGHGFIQADQALAGLGEPPPPPHEPIPPVPHFTYSCLAKLCTFDGTASTDDSGIVSHTWTFGDGQSGEGSKPQHTYGTVGSYTASLTVVDDEGESATATATVTVKKKGTSSGSSDATGEQPVNDFCARNPNHPKCR
ncbi:MAG TPA: PKD domain-containing protein, partial [Desulfurivibrionaceae bacterium]|nr:PKD domain-containing protein [Desulfurivibrionaceae bacterium]